MADPKYAKSTELLRSAARRDVSSGMYLMISSSSSGWSLFQ